VIPQVQKSSNLAIKIINSQHDKEKKLMRVEDSCLTEVFWKIGKIHLPCQAVITQL
jgi:hypothetical protein